MTMPIEEMWEPKYGACDPDDRGSIEIWHVDMGQFHSETIYFYDREDRARLASAAPDMARVLLAIEWSGEVACESMGCSYPGCPSCKGYAPYVADYDAFRKGESAVENRARVGRLRPLVL